MKWIVEDEAKKTMSLFEGDPNDQQSIPNSIPLITSMIWPATWVPIELANGSQAKDSIFYGIPNKNNALNCVSH